MLDIICLDDDEMIFFYLIRIISTMDEYLFKDGL
jgi:hypothetical protein